MKAFSSIAVSAALAVAGSGALAHEWASSEQMAEAAEQVLASLAPDRRERVRFPLDAAERSTWSNLPTLLVPPAGLPMDEMNDAQRRAVQTLLRASMSSQGYAKFTGVMRLEDELRDAQRTLIEATPEDERTPLMKLLMENRDPLKYAIAIFGEPGSEAWGWQLAGHHAAANFTISEGRVAFTPTFLGSSPRVIESGAYAGTMALPHEGDRGIELMNALTPEQQGKARVEDALTGGIVAGPGRKGGLSDFEGLPAAELNADQRRLLRVLVAEYVRNADFDAADAQMEAIADAGWDAIRFSWRGPIEAGTGEPFYYRVHGPRVLIEYHRVDPNHDHSIVRDPANDYGEDWLGVHIEEHHPEPGELRERMDRLLERESDG